jgi:hypothetical protein
MIIVSDTTAISNLAQIGEIDLLPKIYGEVTIPSGVHDELLVLADLGIPIDKVLASSWLSIRTVKATDLYRDLLTELDMGEAESIALAVELKADYLLIDEKKGRKIALEKNLQIIGTLGIIIEAKKLGHVDNIQQKMDDLRNIGFWISEQLYQHVLEIEKRL